MSASSLAKETGRTAFGLNPASYDRSRPDYPDWVFETLHSHCGVNQGTAAFEIGAGTGKATRQLLTLGVNPLLAIEPDPRLATFLEGGTVQPALRVVNSAFEDVELGSSSFDLGTSATAFHWLDEDAALAKIARALRGGGWWAPFWNIYGNPSKPDPFHEATLDLLSSGPTNPSNDGHSRLEFGADVDARVSAINATGAFDSIDWHRSTWSVVLDAAQTVELYASYSNVSLRPDREAVLAELERIAREDFDNQVTRNITTMLYMARRSASG
ncbi:class I SAM-dependent methyltransferase [Devosia ginsengisoli]|uniref:class I SAM-dependent methyltransferase n=1 Tax=Devosia ginsengisoli TaxID=400770 RepID=UPI0026EEADF9|nr:class I SAM-dependent methyltransferase [Devosia ginsengisoli]MCR6673670.1 class I SAM-dependent methyltransferase [Devosia ginsengisoli]